MHSFFSIVFVCFAVAGCARPNYQTSDQNHIGNQGQALSGSQACDLQMSKAGYCVALQWIQQPTDDATGSFTLTFHALNGGAVVDPVGTLSVQIWMPSMGHGSAPVHIDKVSTGVYMVSNVFFSMPGDWEIRVQLKQNGALFDQSILKVTH